MDSAEERVRHYTPCSPGECTRDGGDSSNVAQREGADLTLVQLDFKDVLARDNKRKYVECRQILVTLYVLLSLLFGCYYNSIERTGEQ